MREHPVQFLTNPRGGSRPSRAAMLLAVSLFAILPGCGGGPRKADPDDWVSDICRAAQDLSDERADALLDFFEVDPDNGEAMYEGFERYLKRYLGELDDFDEAVDKAGQPDVKGGDKVRKAVAKYSAEEREANEDARKELRGLDKRDDGLAAEVDDIFFDIDFADLRELLEDSDSADSDTVIDLIEEDSACAYALFAD